ncbi:MAG: LacI family DNA-binding transcriptional regulator [Mesorhizobium sp.]|nr:LacI family DNA-binding transcriptional regulator [Mesorhizobium sp.]MBL8579091.1 LacI family DNA-binding transcriptional regulator [Mesorhizobium sp.]
MGRGASETEKGTAERPARLLDVARRAGVSRATAARALGGYGLVGDDTRERVEAAARELNYSANVVARAMRAGRTLTIGVVIADISNSFFSYATRAIIDAAAQAGYQTLVINTDDDLAREIDAVRLLVEKRVDGLILVASSRRRYEHLVQDGKLSTPLVLLDRRVEGLDVATVTTNDRSGSAAAIDLFIARGHRRIGLLVATAAATARHATAPSEVVSTVSDRLEGALTAIAGHGMELPSESIRYSRSEVEAATEGALELLSLQPRPTAILATNEEMALGVLAACAQLGLEIGSDVSLVSFDDSPWAKVISPAISVIKRPVYELGNAAAKGLIAEIAGNGRAKTIELPTSMIDRRSVADLTQAKPNS